MTTGKRSRVRAPQSSWIAFGTVALVIAGSLTLVALDVLSQPLSRRTVVTGLLLLIVLPAVLLGQYAPPPYRLPYRWRWWLLGAQALLTYLPILLFPSPWLSLLGFLAGAVLLTVPPPSSVVIAAGVVASGPLLAGTLVDTPRSSLNVLVSSVITASSVYGVAHLALLASRTQAAQDQAARLAEQRERDRVARDLHDLLGSSLVSIAVRCESALHRAGTCGAGAPASQDSTRRALAEAAALARRTHAEVRAVAHGRLSVSLQAEIVHARRLLTQAGITTRVTAPPDSRLSPAVGNCLGAALREATGNLLRHSRAVNCEIAVNQHDGRVELTVANDGAPRRRPLTGAGLAGLAAWSAVLGGALTFAAGDGSFRLSVVLPLDPAVALGDPDGVDEGAGMEFAHRGGYAVAHRTHAEE
ncbi:sensor histidine kinase [Streptomyces barkulensis]|uniref:sensor histidine kinase n=2 Tax=Streptomyces barkulensis TaxID=1257026 RepID=UPI000C6E3A53|nr:histidine kinase [Streptomyces barkulensis]